MKIAIVGAGALGAFYGIKLALAGNDVCFLLRNDYSAVSEKGYELDDRGEVTKLRVKAFQNPEDIGVCDLVFIALKTTANAFYEPLIRPLLDKKTLILTVQNGLGNVDKLQALFGNENVLGGICFATVNRIAPGVIKSIERTTLWIAEGVGEPQSRTFDVANLFIQAGLTAEVKVSLSEILWKKLCWNIPFNGLTIAGGNIDCAELIKSEELCILSQKLMSEIQRIALADGVEIPNEHLEKQFALTKKIGPYLPSSLIDYRLHKEVEVESIWGEPLRFAKYKNIDAPFLEALYLLLKTLCRIS